MRSAILAIGMAAVLGCDGGDIFVPEQWRPEGAYTLTATAEVMALGQVITPNITSPVLFVLDGSGVRMQSTNTGFLPRDRHLEPEGDGWLLRFDIIVDISGPTPMVLHLTEGDPPFCVLESPIDTAGVCGLAG